MQKYRIKRTLGVGTFGVVFQAISPNHERVAIKKMKQKYTDWEQCLSQREIKSLKKFDHPNIIKLKEVILANSELFLVFDFLQTNLLQVYLRAQESGRNLTESEIKSIFYKITQGLAYLHKNGFFHRDLKPQNILCHNLDVKICDLGLARQIRSRPPFTEYVSTRWYRAPQLLLHSNSYNSPVDIFALACIIVELYMMGPLFPGNTEIQVMNKIVDLLGTPKKSDWPQGYKLASTIHYNFPQSKGKQLIELIPNASFEAIQLLQSMLNYSSRKRPSAIQILKHPYFDNFKPQNEKGSDSKEELKFSFYDKPIIELPNNIKIENPKEVEMRKSLIKFGDSFTSTFNKKKEKKQQKEFKDYGTFPKKKKFEQEDDHDISKKFDEMQQILLELKKKQEMKNTNNSNAKEQIKQYKYEHLPSENKNDKKNEEQLRLRMFSLDSMAGTKSLSNIMKSPIINSDKKQSKL